MLVVSDEMGFARAAAHTVVFMDNGEIIERGPPEAVFYRQRRSGPRDSSSIYCSQGCVAHRKRCRPKGGEPRRRARPGMAGSEPVARDA